MKRFIAIFMTLCMVLGLSSISVWAAEEATWKEVAPINTARDYGYSCTIGDKIYVVIGAGTNHSRVDTIEIYDSKTNTWNMGSSTIPRSTVNFAACAVGEKIYIIGGTSPTVYEQSVQIYDTRSNTWSFGTSMTTQKFAAACAAVGNKIYVMGGTYNGTTYYSNLDVYDTETNTWTAAKAMPAARAYLSVTAVGSKIYAMGGKQSNELTNTQTVFIYDTETNTWSTGEAMPTGRWGLTTCAVGDKIYAIGGDKSEITNTVEIYSTTENKWETAPSLITPRRLAFSTVLNDIVYVIGGADPKINILNSVETLRTNELEQNPILSVLLNEGETVQLSTSYNLDNNKNYIWSSTNQAVATVDSSGKVTAVAEGITDIYAQNTDGTFKEYIPVKVTALADELRLAVHLKAGEKAKLYLTDDPSKATWTSMDSSIATVAADGQVTGVKKGLAIIKGELEGKSYQIYVRVNG
nr:kelch repeat-containing protein [uncultured Aminipila sp.]